MSHSLGPTFERQFEAKLDREFPNHEERAVVSNLITFLNSLPPNEEYAIHIDDATRLLAFSTKGNAKQTIENYFTEKRDYVININAPVASLKRGRGRPPLNLRMTLATFRDLCMLAKTDNGRLARQYFGLYFLFCQDLIHEERAQAGTRLIETRETAILDHFPTNTQCVYWGTVDNLSVDGEKLYKFGNSNDLVQRVSDHRRTYNNFRLVSAFRVCNKLMIENVIKKDPQLKNRRRTIRLEDGRALTELIAVTDKRGQTMISPAQLDEKFRQIVDDHEYSVDNYARVLVENEKVKNENVMLKEELRLWNEHKKNRADDAVITSITSRNSFSHVAPKAGLLIYAFKCQKDGQRYTCDICRPSDLEQRERLLTGAYPDGIMEYTVPVRTDFAVQVMNWLVRERFGKISQKVYEGTLEDIKQIFAVVAEFEKVVVGETCLQAALDCLRGNSTARRSSDAVDPEIPTVRKAKRPVRQVHPESGRTVATFENIEEAGRAMGTTGTAIGTALRSQRLSGGFRWLYADFSAEEQFQDQPVVKINCKTGNRVAFSSMNLAAKDAGVSVPGLRNRILTDVHYQSTHWVFDRSATHYTGEVPAEAATSDD